MAVVPIWLSGVVQSSNGTVSDSVILLLLGGSVLIAFTMCCMLKCLRYRIPRTKQEIQLRLHKRSLTKNFKRYLDMLTVNTETTFDDALYRVRVLREADLSGFEGKSRRNSPTDQAVRGLKDQCIALSLPEICHAGQNNIALLPLDMNIVKEILRHQHTDMSCDAEREGREKESKDTCKSDNEDSEAL